jgi:hypothetical protein
MFAELTVCQSEKVAKRVVFEPLKAVRLELTEAHKVLLTLPAQVQDPWRDISL